MVLRVLFPPISGAIVTGLTVALNARAEEYTDGVLIRTKLPTGSARTTRMVTVRNDGGPTDGAVQRHGYGFNVYAETSVTADKLARMCMALLPTLATGEPIVHVSGLSGPFEVLDAGTDLLTVGSTTLSHYYFTAQITTRGSDL